MRRPRPRPRCHADVITLGQQRGHADDVITLDALPLDVLLIVCSCYLDAAARRNLRVVCHAFRRLVDEPSVWRRRAIALHDLAALPVLARRDARHLVADRCACCGRSAWREIGRRLPNLRSALVGNAPLGAVVAAAPYLTALFARRPVYVEEELARLGERLEVLALRGIVTATEVATFAAFSRLHDLRLHVYPRLLPTVAIVADLLYALPALRDLTILTTGDPGRCAFHEGGAGALFVPSSHAAARWTPCGTSCPRDVAASPHLHLERVTLGGCAPPVGFAARLPRMRRVAMFGRGILMIGIVAGARCYAMRRRGNGDMQMVEYSGAEFEYSAIDANNDTVRLDNNYASRRIVAAIPRAKLEEQLHR
ncbi:PREDICTED: uncharacterized protein LOC106817206 [Priapulus caudatus]|uniref:Uncharacterized protein LOC106817206 n=1 Tax=Priapulus caudatus TaxID=37621 RepID=A0ABM1EYT6_PRICU|nr:PREDICTED: uncharacterized protein LOC106817206 [Priapulus caudatus]